MIDANVLNETAPVASEAAAAGAGVTVRATKKGFHGVIREIGEVFSVPKGMKGSWFAPVEKPAAAKAKGAVLSDADLA